MNNVTFVGRETRRDENFGRSSVGRKNILKGSSTMKKVIHRAFTVLLAVLLLCGIMPLTASAANDITDKFTDPVFRMKVQELIGKQQILDTDVAGIKELDVNGKYTGSNDWPGYIKSLAGLEYFTSLESLDCSINLIFALTALPPGLQRLSCASNHMTSLDVTGTQLKYLDCSENGLTSLDVTGLALEKLDCRWNYMTGKADVIGFSGEWDAAHFQFDPQHKPYQYHFWSTWPDWFVFILEYVLFGWLWMRWF